MFTFSFEHDKILIIDEFGDPTSIFDAIDKETVVAQAELNC